MAKKNTSAAASSMKSFGKNIRYKIADDTLTIEIPLDAGFEPSSTGVTNIYATSQGNKHLQDGFILGLNLMKYVQSKAERDAAKKSKK